MRVEIKTNGIELTNGLREHTERRLGFALDRAHHDISTITVRLSDINGPRGGADKRCQIQIPLPYHLGVVIEETDSALYVAIDRAASRAEKLRKRLGWEAGILNGNGGRPKGMHWATYRRLRSDHDALVQVSLRDIAVKFGFLQKLLDG